MIENISIHGFDFIYIPRTLISEDKLFGEDRNSSFEEFFTLEMYINSVMDFGGEHEFVSKFGLEIRNEIKLTCSKKRFSDVTQLSRPLEGDLIYFPLSKSLFQIDFVNYDNPFYQFGKLYSYEFTCTLFDYSHESFETSYQEVDDIETILAINNSVVNDKYAENTSISTESNNYIDFNENNPFGNLEE